VSALSNSQVLAAAQAQMATDVQARDGAQDDAPETLEGLDRLQTISQLQELRDRVLDPVLTFRLDRLLDSLRPDA